MFERKKVLKIIPLIILIFPHRCIRKEPGAATEGQKRNWRTKLRYLEAEERTCLRTYTRHVLPIAAVTSRNILTILSKCWTVFCDITCAFTATCPNAYRMTCCTSALSCMHHEALVHSAIVCPITVTWALMLQTMRLDNELQLKLRGPQCNKDNTYVLNNYHLLFIYDHVMTMIIWMLQMYFGLLNNLINILLLLL